MNDNFDGLNKRIKQYYDKQSLPPDVLMDLEETIEETTDKKVGEFDHRWQWVSVRMMPKLNVAVAAALLLLSIFATTFLTSQQFGNQKLETVAAEIALNHAKQFDSEFFVTSIPNLSHSMTLLDFAPVTPHKLQLANFNVMGARYCTVDRSIAVQVRMKDENNQPYTLYEFRDTGSVEIKGEHVITVDNIEVTLWQEGGVIMGLAQRVGQL